MFYVNEQDLFICLLIIAALVVAFILLGIQVKGILRSRLIRHLLEQNPDSVTRLNSNERILCWTRNHKLLTVAYKENVLKDITFSYKHFAKSITISGTLKKIKDFEKLLDTLLKDE